MSSRVRRHKLNLRLLSLAIFRTLLLLGSCFAFGKVPDKSHPSELKFYKAIHRSDGTLLIEKDPAKDSQAIVFVRGNDRLFLKIKSEKAITRLSRWTPERTYNFYLKQVKFQPLKVGFIPEINSIQYDGNPNACPKMQKVEALVQKLSIAELSEKISSLGSEKIIDESCQIKPLFKNKFVKQISTELDPKSSFLMKCLNDQKARDQISKEESLKDATINALSLFTNRVSGICDGSMIPKIGCYEKSTASHNGSSEYDPKTRSIKFPIENEQIAVNPCKTISQLYTHEFFHDASVKDPIIYQLDKICAEALGIPSVKDDNCKREYQADDRSETQGQGPQSIMAIAETAKDTDQKMQAELQPVLQNAVSASEIKPINSADLAEISSPKSQASFDRSVNNVFGAMNANMQAMTAPLNKLNLAASTIPTAVAGTTRSGSKSESAASLVRRNLASSGNSNQEYVAEEILADQYNVPVATAKKAMEEAEKGQQQKPSQQPGKTLAATSGAGSGGGGSLVAPSGRTGSVSLAGSDGGSSSAVSGAPATNKGDSKKAAAKDKNEKTAANEAIPGKRSPASQVAATSTLVQGLNRFTEVRGDLYQKVKASMKDPEFSKQLETKGISIQLKNGSATRFIGMDPEFARVKFIDQGTFLKKVSKAD